MPPQTDARRISGDVARRFLAIRHFLTPPRSLPSGPASVMTVFDRLGSVQFDPIDVCGRNHDLVLLSRISGYRREWTDALLYVDRVLYETYNKGLSLVPTAELPWYRVTWDRNREAYEGKEFVEHADLVKELLDRIKANGPLSSTDVEPRAAIAWHWRPTNQVRAILEGLAMSGVLGISERAGNRRVYDLVERLFPTGLLAERHSIDEQRRHKLMSRYRAHGLLGPSGQAEVFIGTTPTAAERTLHRQHLIESGAIVAAEVEGIRGPRYLPAADLEILDQAEREVAAGEPPGGARPGVAFLAALDPLVWDRDLLRQLYGFDYIWEVYVPGPKRRWGYYVLPLLWGDRFVGRIEPRLDRKAGVLRVAGLWWEAGFEPLATQGFVEAFADALVAHRSFADATTIELAPIAGQMAFLAAVRKRLDQETSRPRLRSVRSQKPSRPRTCRGRVAGDGRASSARGAG